MITRRHALVLAAGAAGLLAGPALFGGPALAAAPAKPFAPAAFEEANRAGGPVLIHIHAPWCPTCLAQKPILEKLLGQQAFFAVKAFEIDYDGGKEAMRKLGASERSTVIVFSKGAEVGRSVGDTSEAGLQALMQKAL